MKHWIWFLFLMSLIFVGCRQPSPTPKNDAHTLTPTATDTVANTGTPISVGTATWTSTSTATITPTPDIENAGETITTPVPITGTGILFLIDRSNSISGKYSNNGTLKPYCDTDQSQLALRYQVPSYIIALLSAVSDASWGGSPKIGVAVFPTSDDNQNPLPIIPMTSLPPKEEISSLLRKLRPQSELDEWQEGNDYAKAFTYAKETLEGEDLTNLVVILISDGSFYLQPLGKQEETWAKIKELKTDGNIYPFFLQINCNNIEKYEGKSHTIDYGKIIAKWKDEVGWERYFDTTPESSLTPLSQIISQLIEQPFIDQFLPEQYGLLLSAETDGPIMSMPGNAWRARINAISLQAETIGLLQVIDTQNNQDDLTSLVPESLFLFPHSGIPYLMDNQASDVLIGPDSDCLPYNWMLQPPAGFIMEAGNPASLLEQPYPIFHWWESSKLPIDISYFKVNDEQIVNYEEFSLRARLGGAFRNWESTIERYSPCYEMYLNFENAVTKENQLYGPYDIMTSEYYWNSVELPFTYPDTTTLINAQVKIVTNGNSGMPFIVSSPLQLYFKFTPEILTDEVVGYCGERSDSSCSDATDEILTLELPMKFITSSYYTSSNPPSNDVIFPKFIGKTVFTEDEVQNNVELCDGTTEETCSCVDNLGSAVEIEQNPTLNQAGWTYKIEGEEVKFYIRIPRGRWWEDRCGYTIIEVIWPPDDSSISVPTEDVIDEEIDLSKFIEP